MTPFWDSEEIFLNGDEYFTRLLADIAAAQKEITVEMYIFNEDALGFKVTKALQDAHERGVKVQVMVDGFGSFHFYGKLFGLFKGKGIKTKLYNPLPFIHPYFGNLSLRNKVSVFFTRFLRLNQRNHRKIIIIDQHILYTGSFNITIEHTSRAPGETWKDAGVRVSGANVNLAVLNFKRLWSFRDYLKYRKSLRKNSAATDWKKSALKINSSIITRRMFYRDFLKRIKEARSHIWLTTPYFIPKHRLIRELGKASDRGVDVQLLTTSKTDVELFRTLQFIYYPELLKRGVKVFQYQDTILHGKIYIVDDWVSVGSTNLNHRSLMHDLEADVILQEEKNIHLMKEDFLRSVSSGFPVTLEVLKSRALADRLLSKLYFIFKYWF